MENRIDQGTSKWEMHKPVIKGFSYIFLLFGPFCRALKHYTGCYVFIIINIKLSTVYPLNGSGLHHVLAYLDISCGI